MARPHRRSRSALPLAAALAASLCVPAALGAAQLQIDSAKSKFLLRVWKEGPASVFAHDHVARATEIKGTVEWDPAKPEDSSVEVEVPAASILMDEPVYRRRFDLPSIADVNRREIQNTMRGSKQLDVATYPTLSFRSQKVASIGPGKLRINGTLTLHGQSREVSMVATVEQRGEYFHANSTFRFLQSGFGITPYSFGQAVRNQDEVELQIELIAK
jgi:polyisoprenoid-binding protein YceI